ncbi:adenylosuccinate synthase [Bacteroidota bacterium]
MSVTLLVGSQWGDEGKGKIVDILSEKYDIVVRYQGGANAGHTIQIGDKQYILHLIPAGILRKNISCVIGNGMVVDPQAFREEIKFLERNNISIEDRLFISQNAHLIMPYHKILDSISESGKDKIGTTGRGIGPCYIDKFARKGIRFIDLLNRNELAKKIRQNIEEKNNLLVNIYNHDKIDVDKTMEEYLAFGDFIKPLISDTGLYLQESISNGKEILLEGAQGTLLDIDHGTYPFVTSSNPTAGGACTGTGIAPTKISSIIGIVKAYTTRVGLGPFPTELSDECGDKLREWGGEYGATTGRPRRCGWFDTFLVSYSRRINGIERVAITKLDVLSYLPKINVCVGYERNGKKLISYPTSDFILNDITPIYETLPGWECDISNISDYNLLPAETKNYLTFISEKCGFEISIISVGPRRNQTIIL